MAARRIVPDEVDGLVAIEQKLSTATMAQLDRTRRSQKTELCLPKFTIDPSESLSLGEALASLGVKAAFDRTKADFTGIANPSSPADRLYIGKVFHKAFVNAYRKRNGGRRRDRGRDGFRGRSAVDAVRRARRPSVPLPHPGPEHGTRALHRARRRFEDLTADRQ